MAQAFLSPELGFNADKLIQRHRTVQMYFLADSLQLQASFETPAIL